MNNSQQIDICDYELDDDFCDEQSDYNPEIEKELTLFATGFIGELKYIARKYIKDFFAYERYHQGGKIPSSLLLVDSHVSMVINYDIIKGVSEAYKFLKHNQAFVGSKDDIPEDIGLVVNILNKLSLANIPQQFAGGMILLYLKLVEGVDIG